MKKNLSLKESLAFRSAKARRSFQARPVLHWLGLRGLATFALGATLSIGGVSEALQDVHLVFLKDLEVVQVVTTQTGTGAKLKNGSGSFSRLSAPPKSLAPPRLKLFGTAWILTPVEQMQAEAIQPSSNAFHEEMRRINSVVRRDFFANAVPFGDLIHEKAQKYDVDPALVAAVVETESRFKSGARSQVGARGLMQLMPSTGRWMGASNLYDPEQNVEAGTKYLKYLNQRFDGNLKNTIAAYNAGEGSVRRYRGVPPFPETRSFVKQVMSRYEQRKKQIENYQDEHPAAAEEMTLR